MNRSIGNFRGHKSGTARVLPRCAAISTTLLCLGIIPCATSGRTDSSARVSADRPGSPMDVLKQEQWREVEKSIDRALAWIATRQQADGSFEAPDSGQPGVTALCVLALLSRGHLPDKGPYGRKISSAIRYVLAQQKADGLICKLTPGPSYRGGTADPAHTAIYNHAIGGMLLCQVYGMTDKDKTQQIRRAIEKAIPLVLRQQRMPKRRAVDRGGWRYLRRSPQPDSDLSVTSWQLMFLRAAKNAGFEVPSRAVDEAVEYIKRCYDPARGTFHYTIDETRSAEVDRTTVGIGILTLSMAGLHDTAMARRAGDWLLLHPFSRYNQPFRRFHYGVFYCTQAMFQLGGRHWREFYPTLVRTLLTAQRPDGSWDSERGSNRYYGNVYTTSLVVLGLSAPYQVLPIFQR